LGLLRLGDIVRIAETQGLIKRRRDITHLELLPSSGSQGITHITLGPADPRLRFVRPEIWKALVFFRPGSVTFFDRLTARVIEYNATEDPSEIQAAQADNQYVKIDTIAAHIQQEWMRAFLESTAVPAKDEAPIESERWWVEFPAWLRRQDPMLEVSWRKYRVESVIAFARSWAEQHNVPIGAVLAASRSPIDHGDALAQRFQPARADATIGRHFQNTIDLGQGGLRASILNAIAEMTVDELTNIAVPVKYLLRHFKVR